MYEVQRDVGCTMYDVRFSSLRALRGGCGAEGEAELMERRGDSEGMLP